MEGDSSGPAATEEGASFSLGPEPHFGTLVPEKGSLVVEVERSSGERSSGRLVDGSSSKKTRSVIEENLPEEEVCPDILEAAPEIELAQPAEPKPETPRRHNLKRVFCIAITLVLAFFALVICLAVSFTSELSYTTTGSGYGLDKPNVSNVGPGTRLPRYGGTRDINEMVSEKSRSSLRRVGENLWWWTRSANGRGSKAGELDRCTINPPKTVVVKRNAVTQNISARLFQTNATSKDGPLPDVMAEVGFGAKGTLPTTFSRKWLFFPASFQKQVRDEDQYIGTVVAPPQAGDFALSFRFSRNNGVSWTYCDGDGAGVLAGPASLMFTLTVV